MINFPSVGIQVPQVLLPQSTIDHKKWAVVACDQYTSQPEYWYAVEGLIADAPSTYTMILPEAYLGKENEAKHASRVLPAMRKYLSGSVFQPFEGFILVERSFNETTRLGLMAALDLEAYDFSPTSQSLIRATEGTILDRLPPRIAIREEAELEIPHILVLIDDPENTVIEPLRQVAQKTDILYDFELMLGSGHLTGYQVNPERHAGIVDALTHLKSHEVQAEKYAVNLETPPLLYAMGDGNHSLATAKAVWEKNKGSLPQDHPSRYALVEIENLHDKSIVFEAIHRLLKGIQIDLESACSDHFSQSVSFERFPDFDSMAAGVDLDQNGLQKFGVIQGENLFIVTLTDPDHTLTVGNVQHWLDQLLAQNLIDEIDYIHGTDTIHELGKVKGHAGIYLPAMPKNALFRSVIKDGPLPRKTFSMGEAHQKRFYMECRKIK